VRLPPGWNSPLVVLLIGLFAAMLLEAIIALPLRQALERTPEIIRWGVTVLVAAAGGWAGARYYTSTMRHPTVATVALTVFPVLLAFRLLADRIAELPSPFGFIVAAALAAGCGYYLYLRSHPRFRTWMGLLFGFLVFVNLYSGSGA